MDHPLYPTQPHLHRDPSMLRRTQTFTTSPCRGEESSVSSLGSFPTADYVAQHFTSDTFSRQPPPSSQEPFPVNSPIFTDSSYMHPSHNTRNSSQQYTDVNSKLCPHCRKEYSTAWAVPKHVQRMHDRSGELHCARCTFKTTSQTSLSKHEKDAHRTCPFCRQVFLLLCKHIGTCPKRFR